MGASNSIESSWILKTSKGSLRGIQVAESDSNKPLFCRYTRIPYALPPVGDLRWRRPRPLPSDYSFNNSSGQPGDFTKFGPVCPQPVYDSGAALDNPSAAPPIENVQSEDCLYLNIWVPIGEPPDGGWPVQIYLRELIENSQQACADIIRWWLASSR